MDNTEKLKELQKLIIDWCIKNKGIVNILDLKLNFSKCIITEFVEDDKDNNFEKKYILDNHSLYKGLK